MTSRPEMYRFHNGEKSKLPFPNAEYENRLFGLRSIMAKTGVETAVFTSMHSIAYYSGFPVLLVWPTIRVGSYRQRSCHDLCRH